MKENLIEIKNNLEDILNRIDSLIKNSTDSYSGFDNFNFD